MLTMILPVIKKQIMWYLIMNQVPGATQYTIALYYMLKTPLEETPLLHSFVHGDDAFRNSRFKLIPYISKVSSRVWLCLDSWNITQMVVPLTFFVLSVIY